MIVLGIDTSGASSSAAVRTEAGAACAGADAPRSHGRVLPALIDAACRGAGATLADVTHVAVARGPGLFTGMRVGLVSAQMLAFAQGLPLAGVSTLSAVAHRVVAQQVPSEPFWVLIDARRREVFAEQFDPAGRSMGPAAVVPVAAAAISDAVVYLDAGAAAIGIPGRPIGTEGLAVEVAQLAAARWLAGQPQDPATPLYLRQPDVTPAKTGRSVLGRP